MKVYIVHYVTQNGTTVIEKAFTSQSKAANYCDSEQKKSNIQMENRNYFYKTVEVES